VVKKHYIYYVYYCFLALVVRTHCCLTPLRTVCQLADTISMHYIMIIK